MEFNIPAEHRTASGVYIIRNSVNAKVYVGSTVNFRRRFIQHRQALNTKKHHSSRLQNFANKYGISTLSFMLLELADISPESLAAAEQRHLAFFNSAHPETGFNIIVEVFPSHRHSEETKKILSEQRRGVKTKPLTPEHKAQLSAFQTGRTSSDETRKKLSEARKLRPPVSKETRHKLSVAHKGHNPSKEARQKMSEAQKGRKWSLEAKQLMSAQRKGRVMSEETKQKISAANKGRKPTEENKRKLLAANLGKKLSEEHRQKLIESRKGKPVSEEQKRKMSVAMSGRKLSEEHKRKLSIAMKGKAQVGSILLALL